MVLRQQIGQLYVLRMKWLLPVAACVITSCREVSTDRALRVGSYQVTLTLPTGPVVGQRADDTAHTGILHLFIDSARSDSVFGRFEGPPLRRGTFFPSVILPDSSLAGKTSGDSVEITLSPNIRDGSLMLYGRERGDTIRGQWIIPGHGSWFEQFQMTRTR